ncbi:regulator of nucleoside diphosphate kinase [Pedobacter sp. UYEF25]
MTTPNSSQNNIIVTTGMFDLLKAQIVRKKLSLENETRIAIELKNAQQVLRKDLPAGVVDVYKEVTVTDVDLQQTKTYRFVPPNLARKKHGTRSILSDMGVALVGYAKGATIIWSTDEGAKTFKIDQVIDI